MDALGALASRGGADFDVGSQRIVFIGESDITIAHVEQGEEYLLEVLANRIKRFGEHGPRRVVDLPEGLLQGCPGLGEIFALGLEELEALAFFVVLLRGQGVDESLRLNLFV